MIRRRLVAFGILLLPACESAREVAGFQLGSERFEALQEAKDRRLLVTCDAFGPVPGQEVCSAADAVESYTLYFRDERLISIGVPLPGGGMRWDSVGAREPFVVQPEAAN